MIKEYVLWGTYNEQHIRIMGGDYNDCVRARSYRRREGWCHLEIKLTVIPDMDKVWILKVDRLTNSTNGNPRYDITFTDGDLGQWTYRTSSDSACVYDVENLLRSRELVDVYLTEADRIYDMRRVTV